MWLQLLIVVVASFLNESYAQKAHVTCERDYTKIGCFKTHNNGNNRVDYEDMKMLINDRDVSSPYHDGYLLNWHEFAESMHSLACRCAEKAKKEGYTYISIRFWGECHGGKDYTAVENLLKSGEDKWRSAHCSDPKFGVCNDKDEAECVGKASADYIYQVGLSKAEENVNGGFTSWSEWSACSATCGSNLIQERERACTNPLPQGSGKPCEGDFTQTKACDISLCPIDGGLSEWDKFSSCTVTCGGGSMKRKRSCTNPEPAHGGKLCMGNLEESRECGSAPCPINGGYSKWSEYGTCSETCGVGSQSRSRLCNNPAPQHDGETCDALGDKHQSRQCKVKECPIHGGYGKWSPMSPCTKSCGSGTRARIRLCNSPVPKHGGRDCPGERQQIEECNTKKCPVDGKFGSWSTWRTCSKDCGGGETSRTRTCSSPAPAHGGKDCSGSSKETKSCNTRNCPVDGKYGKWSLWTKCTKTCGGGSQSRNRACNNPAPAHGGKNCVGAATESQQCGTSGCPVNGNWSPYGPYGPCSKKCGGGIQRKMRYCTNPTPKYGGKGCSGPNNMIKVCNFQTCAVNGGYGSWSGYSSCSRSCGGGSQTRTRACNNPSPVAGGLSCSRLGASSMSKSCNNQACPPKWSGQKLARTCEHHTMNLNCGGGGKIFIDSSSYGRRSSSYCGWIFWFSKNCHSGSSHSQMTSRCNNKQSCSVPARNSVFGDPCWGTTKYLEVRYKCRGGPYAG